MRITHWMTSLSLLLLGTIVIAPAAHAQQKAGVVRISDAGQKKSRSSSAGKIRLTASTEAGLPLPPPAPAASGSAPYTTHSAPTIVHEPGVIYETAPGYEYGSGHEYYEGHDDHPGLIGSIGIAATTEAYLLGATAWHGVEWASSVLFGRPLFDHHRPSYGWNGFEYDEEYEYQRAARAKAEDDDYTGNSRIGKATRKFVKGMNSPGRFGYFVPRGGKGGGVPWAGGYSMVYPLNATARDPRDGRLYAAPGYGVPMSVPLAPNVNNTYNYSWGVPSSRLTPHYRTHLPGTLPNNQPALPQYASPKANPSAIAGQENGARQ